jgi:hypothetical protein
MLSVTRASILSVLAGLASLPAAAQTPAPPQSIFGIYGQSTAGRDSIRITKKSGSKIGVAIKLYYSSGHTCSLNSDGEWREDRVVVIAEGLEANRSCTLNVFFDKGRVRLRDEGYRCAPVYCGTRGKLDDVSLPKSGVKSQ